MSAFCLRFKIHRHLPLPVGSLMRFFLSAMPSPFVEIDNHDRLISFPHRLPSCDPEERESRFIVTKNFSPRVLHNSSPQIISDVFNFVFRCHDEGNDERILSLSVLPPLSNEEMVTILSMIADKSGPKPTMFFFNWAVSHDEHRRFLRLYLVAAGTFVRSRCYQLAHEVMRRMMENFAGMGRLKESIDMVLEMQNQGLQINVHTLNCALKLASNSASKDLLEYTFVEMVVRNHITPNSCSFKTLVNFYCKLGSVPDIERLLRLMTERRVLIDNSTLTAIICAYSAKRCIGKVFGITEKMVKMGLSMNLINYTALINGLCMRGSVKQAFETLEEMVGKGIKPNVYTHTALIHGLCKKGWTEKAFRLFLKLVRSNHYKPNVHTYSSMISGYCKEGKMNRAQMLLARMQEQGLLPNAVTYTTLIDGYCKEGNFERAYELLDQMITKGCDPKIATYNSIIDGLFKKGSEEEAHDLIHSALRRGLTFDRYTYSILIHENCKRGNINQALEIFKEMVGIECKPDIYTYTILISTFCKQRKIKDGERLFEEALRIGLVPSKQTYTSMICGYCKEGNLNAAVEVFGKMKNSSCVPDSITYGALISGLCKESRLDEARLMYEEMINRGLSPCEVTSVSIAYEYCIKEGSGIVLNVLDKLEKKLWIRAVVVLIRKLCSQSNVDSAVFFIRKLLAKNVKIDPITAAAFTNACYSCNKYSVAAEISELCGKVNVGTLEDGIRTNAMVMS